MDPRKYIHKVVQLEEGAPHRLRGNAFAVTDDGGLLTCRHVVEKPNGTHLAIIDSKTSTVIEVEDIIFSEHDGLDLAYLPNALSRTSDLLPVLSSGSLLVGEDVRTFGFYSPSGLLANCSDGLFKGHLVSFRASPHGIAVLSFPIIEGLSGSPLMTYHNGTKVVGICFGSESQRVLASEIVEHSSGGSHYRETVNRIVEFGLAYRVEEIEAFAREIGIHSSMTISDQRLDMPDLG